MLAATTDETIVVVAHFDCFFDGGLDIIDQIFCHTSMDTAELVSASGLQNAVQAFAKVIDEVN